MILITQSPGNTYDLPFGRGLSQNKPGKQDGVMVTRSRYHHDQPRPHSQGSYSNRGKRMFYGFGRSANDLNRTHLDSIYCIPGGQPRCDHCITCRLEQFGQWSWIGLKKPHVRNQPIMNSGIRISGGIPPLRRCGRCISFSGTGIATKTEYYEENETAGLEHRMDFD